MKKSRAILLLINFTAISTIRLANPIPWPPKVEIIPETPTSSDVIEMTLSGSWPDSCIPSASAVLVSDNDIYFDVISNSAILRPCWLVITPWQQRQSVGPLSPGTYNLYERRLEHPLWRPPYPLPVPDPNLYTLITEFSVTPSDQKYTCIFDPDQSAVIQTGGFAGIHETHRLEGQFRLTVDFAAGIAWFDEVDATLSESPFLYTRNPGCCDRFNYYLDAVAYPAPEPVIIHVATDGNDITGDGSVENPFRTIQKGVDTAHDGCTVIIHLGLYRENINFLGKNITLTSIDPADSHIVHSTTIEGRVCFRGTDGIMTWSPTVVLMQGIRVRFWEMSL